MDGDITEDGFKIKGAATRSNTATQPNQRRDNAPDACTICLQLISERAVVLPCNHLTFDFICLVSWLQEQPNCPLCKVRVTEVQYDFRSPEDFKTYRVPEPEIGTHGTSGSRQSRRGQSVLGLRRPVRARPLLPQPAASRDPAVERRRHVYENRLYSLRVGANRISQYRDFNVHDFESQPGLQSRARVFLRRELQVFGFLDTNSRGGNRDYLIEYIVCVLRTNELRGADGRAEELLQSFLGLENTRQLLHELEAWLRSPCAYLRDWDEHVQYAVMGDRSDKR